MFMNLSGADLLLLAGDFLTIYLFGYMHRSFCVKWDWVNKYKIAVPVIYLLDWVMLRLALEPQGGRRYCENTTVNAVISHYISWAKQEKIQTTVSAHIPSDIPVDEMELAITISNLLENAIYACRKLSEAERYIKLTAKYKKQLLFEIENACKDRVPLDEEGHPFSNEMGHGIGTRSVIAFASKTNSEIRYLAQEGRFRVRMIV